MSKLAAKLTKAAKIKIGVAVGALAVTAAVLAVVLLSGKESFRTIVVEELNGTTLVESNGDEAVNAYEGMHLYSGDDVSVQQESDMTMLLDMDKYVYAEPGTHFWLECDGTEENGRTVICMAEGSVLNRITDNLNEGEVYQVDTPNSTMAVRGTVFRVTVYRGEDGLVYTLLEVFEGQVQVDLKTEEGEYNGVTELFNPGESALIRGNFDFSEFVSDGEAEWVETKNNTIKLPIAYKGIPQNTAEVLVKYIDEGDKLCIGKELLMDYTKLAEHRMETRAGKESTCTEAGYEEIWCAVCNEVEKTVELPLAEHEPGEWVVTLEPTCEAAGSRQKVCTVCGIVCEEEVAEALGHTEGEPQILTEASCTEDGMSITKCSVCGTVLSEGIIEKTGHSWSFTVTREASCEAAGEETGTCSGCGATQTKEIAAFGHSPEWEVLSVATCEADGKEINKCSVCGKVLNENITEKTGHSWSFVITGEASCEEAGEETGTCSGCGATQTKEIAAFGHSPVWEVLSVADCETDGREINKCSVCGKVLDEKLTEKTGHSWSFAVTEEASCEEAGEETGTCSECGATQTREIAALGHSPVWEVVSEATCAEVGWEVNKCSVCDKVFSEVSIARNDHSWGNWETISSGSCTTEGRVRRTCISCGDTEELSTGGGSHSISSWSTVREASCVAAGEETGTCSVCGETQTREIAALGHSIVWEVAEEATCGSDGLEIETCSVCDQFEGQRRPIEMTGEHVIIHEHGPVIYGNDGTATVQCMEICSVCRYEGEMKECAVSEGPVLICGGCEEALAE